MKRLALDLGGSFIRCAAAWEGRLVHARAASAPGLAAACVQCAVERAADLLGMEASRLLREVDSVRLATTLPMEGLMDGLVAGTDPERVGLLLSPGCEPLLLPPDREPAGAQPQAWGPLVRTVEGRMAGNGEELQPLNEAMVLEAADDLIGRGVRVIAVALTHSAHNPLHELRCRDLIAQRHPGHQLGAVPVILSHQLGGRLGEASRLAAALQSAGLQGPVRRGLAHLHHVLQRLGLRGPLLLVHREGGLAGPGATGPLQWLRSSPRGAVAAVQQLAEPPGQGPFVVADLSASRLELGMVRDSQVPLPGRRLGCSAPVPQLVSLPGGTAAIARLDSIFRTVAVGPASAGADPGPACFGRGGRLPTLTDADLLLGYLELVHPAPGGLPLARGHSRDAVRPLACALGLDETAAALLIRAAADRDMAALLATAIRGEGLLPEEVTLVAGGGGGALHACGMAREAGIQKVLVPAHGTALCAVGALGMALTEVHELALSLPLVGARLGPDAGEARLWDDYRTLNRVLEHLEGQGRQALERQGVPASESCHRVELDLRFGAQRLEVPVVFEPGRFTGPRDVLRLAEQLTQACLSRHGAGTAALESGVWIANVRVFTSEQRSRPAAPEPAPVPRGPAPEATVRRRCMLPGQERPAMLPVHEMQHLGVGLQLHGPALVDLGDATCLVETGWRATTGAHGALWLNDEQPAAPTHPVPGATAWARQAVFSQGAEP